MAVDPRALKAIVDSALSSNGTSLQQDGSSTVGSCGACLLGLACWVWAVLVCIAGSVFTVAGFVMQKKASTAPGRKFGDITLNGTWIVGFCMAALLPVPLQIWAYSHAPMSLTTPLSGISVLMNMILAPFMLGERLQRWPDLPAASCILLGTVLTTMSGSHEEQSFGIEDLTRLLCHSVFLCSLVPLLSAVMWCVAYMQRSRLQIELSAIQRPMNPNIFEVALPAFVAAGCGGIANIALKGIGELAKEGGASLAHLLLWALLAGMPALGQINYVNRGLRLYLQSVFFPVYSALLVFTCTLYGMIFYQEYSALAQFDAAAAFVFGIALVVVGVVLFTFRRAGSEQPTGLATELAGEAARTPQLNLNAYGGGVAVDLDGGASSLLADDSGPSFRIIEDPGSFG